MHRRRFWVPPGPCCPQVAFSGTDSRNPLRGRLAHTSDGARVFEVDGRAALAIREPADTPRIQCETGTSTGTSAFVKQGQPAEAGALPGREHSHEDPGPLVSPSGRAGGSGCVSCRVSWTKFS